MYASNHWSRTVSNVLSKAHARRHASQRFPLPQLGDSISEGTLLELHKAVGDVVASEEVLAVVETDKVTVDVRSPAAGTLTAFFASVNDTVIVGNDLLEIDVGVGEPAAPSPAAAAPVADAPPAAVAAADSALQAARVHPGGKPSQIRFRLARAGAPAEAEPSSPAAPPAAPPAQSSSAPAQKPAKLGKSAVAQAAADLPARFQRLPMGDEEMDCVDSGGVGFTWE